MLIVTNRKGNFFEYSRIVLCDILLNVATQIIWRLFFEVDFLSVRSLWCGFADEYDNFSVCRGKENLFAFFF